MDDNAINPNFPGLDPLFSAGQRVAVRNSRFAFDLAAGATIAQLIDPFGGGSTYETVGTVPPQLALSGDKIVRGSGGAVAGTSYTIIIVAISPDGVRQPPVRLPFRAALAFGGVPIVAPTPSPASGPLVDPIVYVVGASLEALSYRGTQAPYSYGYSAQGPINLLNMMSPKRLFTVQMGVLRGAFPYYSRPSAQASGSASFTQAGNSGPSINGQVDQVIGAVDSVPAGRQIAVYDSGGRNDLIGSDLWLAKEMANVDKLLAVSRIALHITPGLWKRDTASGGDWASGGNDRARVDAINAKYPGLLAARGPRAVFAPLQDAMIDPASPDGNPKAGYTPDFIHYTIKGSQAAAKAMLPVVAPYFAGVDRKSGTNLLATTGTGGTLNNGVTGTLPTGYSVTKDPTISAAVSIPAAGQIAVSVTRAEAQATAAEGVTITSAKVLDTAGGKFRGLVKVTVSPTPLPISLSAYLIDTSAGANQRAYALYPCHATTAGGVFTQTATTAIDPWDASEGLTLWLETAQDMDVAAASDASMAMVFATSVNQGPVATYTATLDDWWITKVANAAVIPTPTPATPAPSAPASWLDIGGAGFFDASKTAGDNQQMMAFLNQRAGKGDLTRVGTGGSIISVPNGRANKNILRLIRDVSASAATPHYAAANDAAISAMWVGDDRPFFTMFAYMPTDANTGALWGAAIDAGTNLDHVAQYRRVGSGTVSSIRKKSGSASQIDVPTSPSGGDVAGVPVITAVLHDGKAVTTWSNSTTPTSVLSAQDVAAIGGPATFRLFAHKVNGSILNAQCNLDHYFGLYEDVVMPSTQRVADYLTQAAAFWEIPITTNA